MRSRFLITASVLLATACGGGSKIVDPPPPPPPAGFTVTLAPDADDAAAAQALGWAAGIPDADVTLAPKSGNGVSQTLKSSASGKVDFGTVTPDTYVLTATRWLSTSEVAKLPTSQDVVGWVAKTQITVTSQGNQQQVAVPASRRKGLVISEWAFNVRALPEVGQTYPFGGFLELFNNGDTTVYLDGLTIVKAFSADSDYPNFPCSAFSQLGLDPTGIWAPYVQQFPGHGHDYPLAPGKASVIATDAIDHHAIAAAAIDLSHANFEFWGGPGDIDNPAVPNMIDTLSTDRDTYGHGIVFTDFAPVVVLARPYDKATAPRITSSNGTIYAQVPRDHIIDVISMVSDFDGAYPHCARTVNSVFDRTSSDVRFHNDENVEYDYSVSRHPIPVTLSNHVILQNSHNSDADLVHTHRTPGVVP